MTGFGIEPVSYPIVTKQKLFWRYRGLLVFFVGLQCPVQAGSGDLERPADIHNRVAGVIQFLGNTSFLNSDDFWPAAFFPSGSCCGESCLGPLFNQVSLKFR